MTVSERRQEAERVRAELCSYIDRRVAALGTTEAVKPPHRKKFHWPPYPVSYGYHVLASDWTGSAQVEIHGEKFELAVARTPYGVFGRCEAIWLEARGDDLEGMLQILRQDAEPLFQRQFAIAKALEMEGRFKGHVRDLPAEKLVQLLYCTDRDVANEACTEIETHASTHVFTPALIEVLKDTRHPWRRSAQWCVLDLFEDLPSFVETPEEEQRALAAIRDLIWGAEDDYARTVYKAGVVLGGHLPHKAGGRVLIECLRAPSLIGRRSAIHGLFHAVEWVPALREEVVQALRETAEREPNADLKRFAEGMARDIEREEADHVPEPVFEFEV